MFDIIFVFNTNCLGVVESSGYANFTILKEEWAPGIWTGVRDCVFSVNKEFDIHVTHVDLENRKVYYKINEAGPYLKAGDKIYFKD